MMKFEKIESLRLFVAAAFMLTACSGNESDSNPDMPIPDDRRPIMLSSATSDMTRGMQPLDYDMLKERHFGVFAAYTAEEDFGESSVAGNYLYNHEFEESGEGFWHGSPAAYWPLGTSSKLTFFAYAPYDRSLTQVGLDSYRSGALQIDYRPSTENIADQLDLCVADATATLDRTDSGAAMPIVFEHCLTHVSFYARYTGTPPAGYKVKVDEIKLKHIVGHKILTYDLDPDDAVVYVWSDDSEAGTDDYAEYRLLRTDVYQHLGNVELLSADDATADDEAYLPLQLINGYLYLLPQTPDGASVDIVFSFNEGDKICAQFSRTVALPNDPAWGAGRKVNYKITIDAGVSNPIEIVGEDAGEISVEAWKPADNDNGDTLIE